MTLTLSETITRVQAQLLDDGTRFSTATCTSAIRQALRDFNQIAPVNAAELVEIDSTIKQYELTGGDFPAFILDIHDVLLNDDNGDDDEPLDYDKIFEDNRTWIRLRELESSGNLLVRYSTPHTIENLDDETETTLNLDQVQVLVDGACAYCCSTRSVGIIEDNNIDDRAIENLENASIRFLQSFRFGIVRFETRPQPVSERRTTSWLTQNQELDTELTG